MEKFGDFKDGTVKTYQLPYGASMGAVVKCYNPLDLLYDDTNCYIYWNGEYLKHGWGKANLDFKCTGNMTIEFRWRIAGSLLERNARSWYDCYIYENK